MRMRLYYVLLSPSYLRCLKLRGCWGGGGGGGGGGRRTINMPISTEGCHAHHDTKKPALRSKVSGQE